jgi:tetratricopeptide (TPR) repeat protein
MRKRWRVLLWLLTASIVLGLSGVGAKRWYRTTRPAARLRRGLEVLRQGDYSTVEEITRRLESAGHADQAHLLSAALHLELDRPNEAVERFNQIEATEVRLEAATRYGEWLVRHPGAQPAEAERLLRFVLSERPDDLVAHRGLAAIYYDQGAWALAVLHLLRWGGLAPQDGRPHRFAGLIYKDMDHPAPAIPCYREALRRDLKPAVAQEVREELAECLVARSLYAEALEVLRDCGPRAEQVPRLLALRGECLSGLGRTAGAEALLEKALEQFPQALELLRARGKLLASSGKPREAAALFERALALDPHDATSRYQLMLAYERLKRPDDAARHRRILDQTRQGMLALTRLIQEAGAKPWDAALHRRLAEQCDKMGRPDLARRWKRAAAAVRPPSAEGKR